MTKIMSNLKFISTLITICLLFHSHSEVYAQKSNEVVFSYDENGNRYSQAPLSFELLTDSTNAIDSLYCQGLYKTSNKLNGDNYDQIGNPEHCEVIVYPNPFNSSFKVDIEGLKSGFSTKLTITSSNGSVLKTLENLQESTVVNIADLNAGTYFLVIYIDGMRTNWKMIKR